MIRRLCSECGTEMTKELMPEGPRFYCDKCAEHTSYEEFDMEPHCPECGEKLQFCAKCSQGFFCNTCNGLVSRKKIVWKEL